MLEALLFTGYLVAYSSAEGGADLLLSCSLVEEAEGLDAMRGGALFTRTPATLVLRDVAVLPDQLLETLTPFIPPAVPDPDAILIEAKASSLKIPDADLFLHADCNEQEVMCEISRYFHPGSQNDTEPSHFVTSLHIKGGSVSTTLFLQTLVVENDGPEGTTLVQKKLGLPLSKSGSLLAEVVFLVFSKEREVSACLRGDTLLNCGFRQQENAPAQELVIEWWQQYRGKGLRVLDVKIGLTDSEENSTSAHVQREGSSVDTNLVVKEGNASLTLTNLKVSDEGTYICTVNAGVFQAQQTMKLHVNLPPRVSLSEEKLVFQDLPQKLSCFCMNYYPLDSQMEWLTKSPENAETTVLSEQVFLSSHQQHRDETFSLSSHLYLEHYSFPPGSTIICRVSHPALATPVSVSLVVEEPKTASYMMVLGFLFITVLFFYQIMR